MDVPSRGRGDTPCTYYPPPRKLLLPSGLSTGSIQNIHGLVDPLGSGVRVSAIFKFSIGGNLWEGNMSRAQGPPKRQKQAQIVACLYSFQLRQIVYF